jgi:poly(A) polymerase
MKFMAVRSMRESTRKRFLRQSLMPELLELHRLDCQSSHGKMDAYQFCVHELATLPPEALTPKRLLTGDDLIELGIPPGPLLGELLHKLEDAQLEGTITTPEQASVFVEASQPPKAPALAPSSTSERPAVARPDPSNRS